MSGVNGAITGFREGYFSGDPSRRLGAGQDLSGDYGSWDARRSRYDLHWSMYRNNTYRSINRFAQQYKGTYGLYRHTRGVYSPSKRIADFGRTHIWSGTLDPAAGDGKEIDTSVPIEGADDALRAALARLWWNSNLEVRKGVCSLWGTVLGDVFLQAVDRRSLESMAIEVVHPGTISYLQKDDAGDILAYQKRQTRPDPEAGRPGTNGQAKTTRDVEYLEEASIEGGKVVYRTYRDGSLYDWTLAPDGMPFGTKSGAEPERIEDYDFIPLYHIQHIDEGLGWGCSEFEGGRAKIDEVNDLGSKLHDQIRKMVEGAWLFTGMVDPKLIPPAQAARTRATTANPEPGRQELKVVYEPKSDAKPWSLVGDLDIASTSAEIRQTLDSLEDDYPELRFERLRLGGTVSGEALKVAQQPAATKIQERRANYDYALACVQMAAVAIGGANGYDGYQGFGIDSYSARKPTHRIGRRPVFATSPAEAVAEKSARFAALKVATDAGFPIEIAMADLGYSAKDVAEVVRLKDEASAKAMEMAKARGPLVGESSNQPKSNA